MRNRAAMFFLVLAFCGSAMAQSYSGDARKIAMGGIGYSENIAAGLIEEQREYRSIVIPLGIIQMVRDIDKLNPDNEDVFDPILAAEYAANPIHYGFDRVTGGARGRFVTDIVNAEFTNLNDYRGFDLTDHLVAEGLLSPTWGKTFKVKTRADGGFQGFFIGAGPYLSANADLRIDRELIEVFNSPTDVDVSNRIYHLSNRSAGQLAMSIAGGYRGRFHLPGGGNPGASDRNGIYVAVNYRYLWGFRYEDVDLALRFDTDAGGEITAPPAGTDPLAIDRVYSDSGRGFAFDFGIGAVVNAWEFGFGVNGVANRIDWDKMELTNYRLERLNDQGDLIEQDLPTAGERRVELTEEYIGNVGYTWNDLTAVAEIIRGFQGNSFHGGLEYRFDRIEFRGGARYGLDRWHPSAGIGLNLGERFSVDVAAFWSTTNVERRLKPGLAVSLRFNRAGLSREDS